MPVIPPVALVNRWGDAVYQLALLIADDRQQAEQLTVAAFRRARPAESIAEADNALFESVLGAVRTRRPGLALPGRKHVLPMDWAALPALERGLLGLWLLRDVDGPRLAELSHLAPEVLTSRLATVLAPALDEAPAEEFNGWLAGMLGLAASTPSFALEPEARARHEGRRKRLAELSASLRETLGSLHLPPVCAEQIAALDNADTSGAWRRSRWWIVALVGAVVGMLVLVIAPWRGRVSSAGGAAAIDSPAALVQRALDAWEPVPGDGTFHRRVWAVEDSLAARAELVSNTRAFRTLQPHVTDIWLSPAGAFRLEVTREKQTVEWMLADGEERFEYAVAPPYSACSWSDIGLTARGAYRFDAPPELQREVVQSRLKLGAYGAGYHSLQDALAAGDLRSYGRRVEGDTQLIALGYTAPNGRNILLLLDAATGQLRAVREVAAQGTQAAARDLWRIELDETIKGTPPRSRPDWAGVDTLRQSTLLDPSCPELRPDLVISLRSLVGRNLWWGQPYVPSSLPPGVERMLLLSPSQLTDNNFAPQDLRLMMVGPGRWLRLRMGQGGVPPADSLQVGVWDVTIDDRNDRLRASLCRLIEPGAGNRYCSPAFELTASGWSEPELLAMIEDLTPVRPDTWQTLDDLFVEGAPLAPETEQLLVRAVSAALPPAEGVLHTRVESESRVDPRRPVWQDPYHVPLNVLQPRIVQQQQWLRYAGGTLREQRNEHATPDGMLLSANATDGQTRSQYQRSVASLRVEPDSVRFELSNAVPLELALVLPLLESTDPITVSTQPEGILLQQPAGSALSNWAWTSWWVAMPWSTDLSGRLERRLWLDPAGSRTLKVELIMVDDTGGATLLNRTTVDRRPEAAMPEPVLIDPAGLPPDTLVFRSEDPAQALSMSSGAPLERQPPAGVLVLPDAPSTSLQRYIESPNLVQALNGTIHTIGQTGFADVRRYELPGVRAPLFVLQGPRELLSRVLRSTLLNTLPQTDPSRVSEPVPVTLDGQPSTAWIIWDGDRPMLVAEVADVLLTFSVSDVAALRGPVAEALGRMVWQKE